MLNLIGAYVAKGFEFLIVASAAWILTISAVRVLHHRRKDK